MNFDRYIEERTADYSPRPWLFDRIAAWLASPASRYLLITAEPGAGKTGIAAQVVLASRGLARGQPTTIPFGSIAAHHFCSSKDAGWIEPLTFSRSVSAQLTASVPGFEKALIDSQPASRQVTATAQVQVDRVEAGGQVTGVQLTVQAASPQSAFNWEVRTPLEKLYEDRLDRDVIILIDALDEARLASQTESIFDLIAQVGHWPPRVRFLVTSRPEQPIVRTLQDRDPPIVCIALGSGDERERSRHDVRRYVADRTSRIAGRLAPGFSTAALGEQLSTKADGNFLWAVFAMSMLASAREPVTPDALAGLPKGLSPLYLEFIERLARANPTRWISRHAQILGTLVAAQEAMTEEELARYSGVDRAETTRVVSELTQLLDRPEDESRRTWSIYHRSFADFLVNPAEAQEYVCDEPTHHRRIVNVWLNAVGTSRERDWAGGDRYARRNIGAHLFALRSDEAMRGHLYALVSRQWKEIKGDDASFAHDVALAAEAAAEVHPAALVEQVRATAVLTAVHSRAQAVPARLLSLMARLGNLDGALSYLALSNTADTKVRAAVEIAEALLATDPRAAQRVLDEVSAVASSEQAVGVRVLQALALASMGRFDDLMPLAPAFSERQDAALRVATLAVGAGRYDVAEEIIRLSRGSYGGMALTSEVITGALARGDLDVACRIATASPADHPEDIVRVARAFRTSDPARSVETASMARDGWHRTDSLATLVVDAALESEKAVEALQAHLPASDTSSILERAATIVSETGNFDAALRLADRVGPDAVVQVHALQIDKLLQAGEIARATEIANAHGESARDLRLKLATSAAAHGSVEQVVSAIAQLAGDKWQIHHVLTVAARDRDRPAFVLSVLDGLGDAATVATRAHVAQTLVEHGSVDAAFGIADAAPGSTQEEIVRSIAQAAIDADLPDAAWRAYTRAPAALTALANGIAERLIERDRLDDARTIAASGSTTVDARVRGRLIDRLVEGGRVRDAIEVARGTYPEEIFLARVLLRAPSADTLQAVRAAALSIDPIVERAANMLQSRRRIDEARDLRAHHQPQAPDGNDRLSRLALDAALEGDVDAARQALRHALDGLSLEPHTWVAPRVVARVAAAALHVLPHDDSVATIRSLSPKLGLEDLFELAAVNGDAKAAMAAALANDGLRYRAQRAIEEAIESLAQMHRWAAAVQLALTSEDEYGRKQALCVLVDAAAWEEQLDAAVAAGTALDAPDIDKILLGFADRPTRLSLRIQAVALLDRHDYRRGSLVNDLVGQREFARAADVARDDGGLLAKVLSSSVAAGTPLDVASLSAVPGDVLENAIGEAARQLLAAGRHQDACDYARRLPHSSWEQRTVAEGLARSGRVDLALDIGRTASAGRRDEIHAAIAPVVAVSDHDAAIRIVRGIRNPGERAAAVAAVIEALLAASHVERALSVVRASTLLSRSVDALTRVATALLDAGQREEANSAVATALQFANSVEDTWSRNAALYDLGRALIRRRLLDRALTLNELIPRTDSYHAWLTMDIARQRMRDGDLAMATSEVNAAIGFVRQSSNRHSVPNEAQLSGLLISLRGLASVPAVFEDISAAARPNRSLVPFILADLTRYLGGWDATPSWHRALDRPRRWLWRRRAARWSAWLLERASTIAAADADEHMRMEALSGIAVRYTDLARHEAALEIARAAKDAVQWPHSQSRLYVVTRIGFSYQMAGNGTRAGELLREAIETVVGLEEPDYNALLNVSRLLAALGAPADAVDRLLSAARDESFDAWRFIAVLGEAAEGDAERATRIGRAFVGAAAGAPRSIVGPLCEQLIRCSQVAKDSGLLDEAWIIAQRLDARDAGNILSRAAPRIAKSGAASARAWTDAALHAIAAHPDPESIPHCRTEVAEALWQLGARDEAWQQLATALAEVRTVSRTAFFVVLRAWIAALEDDPRVLDVAQVIAETERWWDHRQGE